MIGDSKGESLSTHLTGWGIVVVISVLGAGANLLNLGSRFHPINPVYLDIRLAITALTSVLLLLLALRRRIRVRRRWLRGSIGLILYGCAIVLSGTIHGSPSRIVEGIWISVWVPTVFIFIVPQLAERRSYVAVLGALVVSALPYIIVSLASETLSYPYRGVLGNPNQLGMLLAGVAWALSCLVYAAAGTRRALLTSVLVIAVVVVIALIMYTGSRSSVISVIASLIVVGVLLAKERVLIASKIIVAVVSVLGIAFLFVQFYEIELWPVAEGIVDKHRRKMLYTVVDGREHAWEWAMSHVTMLGHHPGVLSETVGFAAHNSFVSALVDYGVIGFLLLITIAVHAMWLSWRSYARLRGFYALAPLPLVLFVGFWSLALTEGLFGSIGRGATVAFFTAYGIVIATGSAPGDRCA